MAKFFNHFDFLLSFINLSENAQAAIMSQ